MRDERVLSRRAQFIMQCPYLNGVPCTVSARKAPENAQKENDAQKAAFPIGMKGSPPPALELRHGDRHLAASGGCR